MTTLLECRGIPDAHQSVLARQCDPCAIGGPDALVTSRLQVFLRVLDGCQDGNFADTIGTNVPYYQCVATEAACRYESLAIWRESKTVDVAPVCQPLLDDLATAFCIPDNDGSVRGAGCDPSAVGRSDKACDVLFVATWVQGMCFARRLTVGSFCSIW